MNKLAFRVLIIFMTAVFTSTFVHAATIAVVFSTINESTKDIYAGFNGALSEKGITSSAIEYNLKEKDVPTVVDLIQSQKPDIIFTIGDEAARTVKTQLASIPAVYSLVSNSADVDSALMTGVSIVIPAAMRVDLIKKVLPGVKKIGVIYSSFSESNYAEISDACAGAGIAAIGKKIEDEKDFVPAVQSLMNGQVDSFLIVLDTKIYFGQTVKVLLLESLKNKVPVIGLSGAFTRAGAVMSPDCDYHDLGSQAGELAARIIKGEKPGSIKSVRPRKVRYSLNLQVAGKLGIVVSPAVISGAVDVVR